MSGTGNGHDTPFHRAPSPYCCATLTTIEDAVDAIQRQVVRIGRVMSSNAYVFIMADGRVYVLPEHHVLIEEWTKPGSHWADFVACYRAPPMHKGACSRVGNDATLEAYRDGILEDVTEHLRNRT